VIQVLVAVDQMQLQMLEIQVELEEHNDKEYGRKRWQCIEGLAHYKETLILQK
jgi:hypothetical protein